MYMSERDMWMKNMLEGDAVNEDRLSWELLH